MSRQEALLISAVVRSKNLKYALREGVTPEHFTNYREEWEWLESQGRVPSRDVFNAQFPDFRWRRVNRYDIPAIADGLKENYAKTEMARVLERGAKQLRTAKGVELAQNLHEQLNNIIRTAGGGRVTDVLQEDERWLREFRRKQKLAEQGLYPGIATGIEGIDSQTGGYQDSQLYAVIARQGNAKTYWMLYCAARALLAGKKVLWVSREMPNDMVTYRVHTILSTILLGPDKSFSNLALILGKTDVDYDEYRKFLKHLKTEIKGSLIIPEERRVSIKQMSAFIEREEPDVAFYDFIGIIAGGEAGRSWQELGEQANIAKENAMAAQIPYILASTVNRQATSKEAADEAPMVENIAYSDAIGYACDLIFSLKLSAIDDNIYGPRYLDVWVRKTRYGINDFRVVMQFDGDRGHFLEVGGPKEVAFSDVEGETKTRTRKRSSASGKRGGESQEQNRHRSRRRKASRSEG